MAIDAAALRSVPLLSDLDDRELRGIASALKERAVEPGEVLVTEGSGGIGFFMILEGQAEVAVRGNAIATLGPGDYFGELALFDLSSHRMATVSAKTAMRCVGLSAWSFRPFVRENPEVAWKLLETMARRVREAEERHYAESG